MEEQQVTFDFGKKKKKSKVADPQVEEKIIDEPDYDYEFLARRLYEQIGEQQTSKYVMKPPYVRSFGTRTTWSNFHEICMIMKRDCEHVCNFFTKELGVVCSVTGNQSLILRGRYTLKNVESVLKKYIRTYIKCRNCNCPDTQLEKGGRRGRLLQVVCNKCKAVYTIEKIK